MKRTPSLNEFARLVFDLRMKQKKLAKLGQARPDRHLLAELRDLERRVDAAVAVIHMPSLPLMEGGEQ